MWQRYLIKNKRFVEKTHSINNLRNNGIIEAIIVEDEDKPRQRIKKKVLDYISTIQKRAEKTNLSFIQKSLPYRLEVYTLKSRAFISVTDAQGKTITRDITDDDFCKIMDNISTGTGLIFDS